MSRIIYSDHQKWKDKRHRQLSILEKVVYDYLWDNASESGFYKVTDPFMDSVLIGCDEDEYKKAIASLSQPKSIDGGHEHRGFVLVGPWIWISHYIDHTQQKHKFGTTCNWAHKSVMKDLFSHYDDYKLESEYRDVIMGIQDDVLLKFEMERPAEKKRDIPEIPSAEERFKAGLQSAPSSEVQKPIDMDKLVAYFNKAAGKRVKLNKIIERNVMDLIREGTSQKDIAKVIDYLAKEWGQDEKMKKHLTLEVLLGDKFPKYLNMAQDAGTTESNYIPPHLRNKQA